MTQTSFRPLRRFVQDETGAILIPFVIWSTVILGLILSTMELGAIGFRHYALERALDGAAREVRLSTGREWTHAELKEAVCERAQVIPNCAGNLQLEMIRLDLRDWTPPSLNAGCADRAENAASPGRFESGASNQIMMLRACFAFEPIAPTAPLAPMLSRDANGETWLVSTSAFVMEPQ